MVVGGAVVVVGDGATVVVAPAVGVWTMNGIGVGVTAPHHAHHRLNEQAARAQFFRRLMVVADGEVGLALHEHLQTAVGVRRDDPEAGLRGLPRHFPGQTGQKQKLDVVRREQ